MRLSEAIFRGSLITAPLRSKLRQLQYNKTGNKVVVTHTCALGAALVALNGIVGWGDNLVIAYPFLRDFIEHPCYPSKFELSRIIADLNDRWLWSREKIATWVASIEDQHPEWYENKAQDKIEVAPNYTHELELVAV